MTKSIINVRILRIYLQTCKEPQTKTVDFSRSKVNQPLPLTRLPPTPRKMLNTTVTHGWFSNKSRKLQNKSSAPLKPVCILRDINLGVHSSFTTRKQKLYNPGSVVCRNKVYTPSLNHVSCLASATQFTTPRKW